MKKINPTLTYAWIGMVFMLASPFLFSTFGQQSFTYRFSDSPITSIPPGGPVLEPIGNPVTPVNVIIPFTTCSDMPSIDLTYFPHNSGFKAKAFFVDKYSIEMIFRFTELNGYNRIIDFSNSISDHGIYTLYECLNFFPSGNVGPCPAFDTTNYKQIVITRDNQTKEMNVYVDGTLFTNHVDDTDYYVIGGAPNDSIKFFKDDLAVTNEASPGYVALIRMCDFELSPQDVADSYNSFCHRITGIQDVNETLDFSFYPNPAKDQLTFQLLNPDFSKEMKINLVNTIGQKIIQVPIHAEKTSIDLDRVPSGVYFYQLQISNTPVKTGKIIVDQ